MQTQRDSAGQPDLGISHNAASIINLPRIPRYRGKDTADPVVRHFYMLFQ